MYNKYAIKKSIFGPLKGVAGIYYPYRRDRVQFENKCLKGGSKIDRGLAYGKINAGTKYLYAILQLILFPLFVPLMKRSISGLSISLQSS